MKIALLSNVNMNPVARLLKGRADLYAQEGYGGELGLMLDEASLLWQSSPESVYVLMDLQELTGHTTDLSEAGNRVGEWFVTFEAVLSKGRECVFYVSDAYAYGSELAASTDYMIKARLEGIWNDKLLELAGRNSKVRVFPYRNIIDSLGETAAFSDKMWYLGKILHSGEAQSKLADEIEHLTEVQTRTPAKVLVLDLDNTLWGGIAGEADITPIKLSDDHAGLAYKNLQRVIKQMEKGGVILAVASKNNKEDALKVISTHPHMVLREEDFAALELNWDPKPKMLERLAATLNLSMDSFVFFDDNPAEREAVKAMLPMVSVPDFPDKPEKLPGAMLDIYKKYFQKAYTTAEDLEKTKQYAENAKRSEALNQAASFEDYLKSLETEIIREDALENSERVLQLLNKTNQFNLTTMRHTAAELEELLKSEKQKFYVYRVKDRFGDNGIVAIARVELLSDEAPRLAEFVMSCRVMGRRIEDEIVDEIANDLRNEGKQELLATYIPSAKNMPVAALYDRLGFGIVDMSDDGSKEYLLSL